MEYNKIERIKKSSICIMIRVRGIKIIVEQHLKIHNQIMDGTHVQDVEENLDRNIQIWERKQYERENHTFYYK